MSILYKEERKGVRVVEGIDLERLYDTRIIEGSNPSLSVLRIEVELIFEYRFFSNKD